MNLSGTPKPEDTMAPANVDDEARQPGLKQLRKDGTEEGLDRPMSSHHAEAADAERRLGMMEGASWGGGHNE
jgi:hypothetical protein